MHTISDDAFAQHRTGADDDVTLHAPKGMALRGDTLWVADIDALRGFSIASGKPVATVDLTPLGATFLNDVAIGVDGGIYITDSGIAFAADGSVTHPGRSRIFVVRNLAAREAVVESPLLPPPLRRPGGASAGAYTLGALR